VAYIPTVTENEVNSYLVYEAKEQLPTGVVEPSVTILGLVPETPDSGTYLYGKVLRYRAGYRR